MSSHAAPVISIRWLIVAGACAPFGFNVVGPLLPFVRAEFGLPAGSMQALVSMYAFTMAFGQLFGGPLSDAYGRRRVIIAGLGLFTLASLGATFAPTWHALLAFRLLQGLGACMSLVVPRAAVRDRYAGPDAARAMALVMISLAVTPALAPLVGGILQTAYGWRAGFAACVVVGSVLFAGALRLHHETLPREKRVRAHPVAVLQGYAALMANARFMAYTLGFSLLNCSFIGFFVAGPIYLSAHHGFSAIGVALTMLAAYLGFAAGNQISARQVRRAGVDRLIMIGVVSNATGTALLCVAAALDLLFPILLGVAVQSFGTGLAFATGIAGATSVDLKRIGSASALTGAFQLGTGAVYALVTGLTYNDTLVPMAVSSLVLCLVAAGFVIPLWRRRAPLGTR